MREKLLEISKEPSEFCCGNLERFRARDSVMMEGIGEERKVRCGAHYEKRLEKIRTN